MVTLFVGGPDSTGLRLAGAYVDFGDGSTGSATGSCTADVTVAHVYRRGGDYRPSVTGISVCAGASPVAIPPGDYANLHVFPAAPASSASWPACSTFQLHMAGRAGESLSHGATTITLKNVGGRGCTLDGFPEVLLLGRGGILLSTHTTRVEPTSGGDFLFAAVVPHVVALAPGDVASFMIGWIAGQTADNQSEPYEVACPPAAAVRVILPGTHQFGMAAVSMNACDGTVEVSPIVPGADGIGF